MFQTRRPGKGKMGCFMAFILVAILLLIGDIGFIRLSEECIDEDIIECIMSIAEEEVEPEGSVTATGVISGEKGSITLSLTFPLEGGAVSGSFSGDCDGTIKGSFAGGNGGVITGKAAGSCGFFLPASGNFSGSVNTASKTVPVSGKGGIPGFSKEGSVTLSY